MFLDVIDTLVGFVTVVVLLSVVVTALTQATQATLRLRGRNLHRGLELLFRQAMISIQEGGSEKPVGLLVVHGMGKPKEGATRDSVVRGLRKAYPEARFETHDKHADMIYKGRRVRVYEVYWGPVLMGKTIHGSFSIRSIYEFVWFPSLNNLEKGSVHEKDYDKKLVMWWRTRLLPLAMFAGAIYFAITIPLLVAGKIVSPVLKFVLGREVKPKSAVDNWLAERIGDVFNYVNAYVCIPDPSRNPVPDAPQKIYAAFQDVLEVAARECSEVQILGHSLGTVVVHHALTRFSDQTRKLVAFSKAQEPTGRPPLTFIYTIGSPLEKIRFFWPKVALEMNYEGEIKWYNFQSRADVVAGTLKLYRPSDNDNVKNYQIRGGGGLITAHTGYRSHPTFLSIFGPRLTGFETAVQPSAQWRWLRSLQNHLETVVATFALGALILVGMAIFFGVGYGGAQVVLQYAGDEVEAWKWVTPNMIAFASGLVLTSIMIVLAPFMAKTSAQDVHKRHWLTVTGKADRTNPEKAGVQLEWRKRGIGF